MSPYEPPGYRIIRTPAAFSRSDTAGVPSSASQTASFTPSPVPGIVARPPRAFTATFTGVVAAPASGAPGPVRETAAASAATVADRTGRRRSLIEGPITGDQS